MAIQSIAHGEQSTPLHRTMDKKTIAIATIRTWSSPRSILTSLVSGSTFQSPGDINAELDLIHQNIVAFGTDFTNQVTSQAGYPHAEPRPPLEELYANTWGPFYRDWEAFYTDKRGSWSLWWWNPTGRAEAMLDQYTRIRAKAEELGLHTNVPDPPKPPPGALESFWSVIWNMVKAVLWIGLGIATISLIINWVRH